ncbi:MAG: NAD(P)H-hydrate dehydratase [Deferribacteres bacterium]|nr:NAD(P)H-hydrate dehydratase [Deferribacteres bacterium]
MQSIDRVTIEDYGIAGTILMERAGLAVVSRINELFFGKTEGRQPATEEPPVIVLCGGGNNGGDGFVIARILQNEGKNVEVFLSARPENLKGDARINYDAAKNFGVKISPLDEFPGRHPLDQCIIVDALLGTGLSKEVRAPLSEVINAVNHSACPVVSVDIPSGISSDTGQVMGCAVKARYTVTFGLPKRGHLLYPGAGYSGRLFIEDIGFPVTLLESEEIRVNLPERGDMISLLPERPAYSHKGTYGHVLLVAGSRGKTGAALMAARACLRTGAGLVTIGVPESLVGTFQSMVTEEMILPLADKGNGTLSYESAGTILEFLRNRADVLAAGPGLSVDGEITGLIGRLIAESVSPVVIDADGLNAVAGNTAVLRDSRFPVVLTPHTGEMARLLHGPSSEEGGLRAMIEKDRISTAVSFAEKTGTYLVLKGVPTVTATPEGDAFINPTGNPGMASAGSGDVLTGIISAFLAQGLGPRDASVLGVYMHGLAGDIAAREKGQHSVIASDITAMIPAACMSLSGSRP